MSLKIASLNERKSIYEIFRSCRLCGAGGGYKMPIIQNVVDLDDTDIELSQKIKECVQIEVSIDDKMPPLICELCIDKVNDYHAFMIQCKEHNNKTRTQLGLPPNRSSSPVEESILGVTEALCERDSSDNEPIVPRSTKPAKGKLSKGKKGAVKYEKEQSPPLKASRRSSPPPKARKTVKRETRTLQDRSSASPDKEQEKTRALRNGGTKIKSRIRFEDSSSPSPPPTRTTRNKTSEQLFDEINWDRDTSERGSRESSPLLVVKDKKPAQKSRPGPKSKQAASLSPKGKQATTQSPNGPNKNRLSKDKQKEIIEEEKPKATLKRSLVRESTKPIVPAKKTKPGPKPKALPTPKEQPSSCDICAETFASTAVKTKHERTHVVTFTETRLACNACEDWFSSYSEAATHHAWHGDSHPYNCTVCGFDYDTLNEYNDHLEKYSCRKFYSAPDVQCLLCWNEFPTHTSLTLHTCLGEDGRPGGKCSKCGDMYALLKDLIDHESECTEERRANLDPEIRYKIKPTQVLVAKCDKLLERKIKHRIDVSNVPYDFGMDPNCYYPYFKKQIKTEKTPFDGMVNITNDVYKNIGDNNSGILSDEDLGLGRSRNRNKKQKVTKPKAELVFDDILNDDQPAFSQSYNFDSLIDSLDDRNNDSGEESVIKNFGFPDKVQNKDLNDESVINTDVVIKTDKSPVKNNPFDIESLIKVDKNDNDNENEIDISETVIGPLDNEKETDIPVLSENGDKTVENENVIIKESPNTSLVNDIEKNNDSTEMNKSTENLDTKTTIEANTVDSVESSKTDLSINQSVNQSEVIEEKLGLVD